MWFAIAMLACFLPPSVLAAVPPRTPVWRRARKWYWITLPLGAAVCGFNAYFIDPAGPAIVFYGAWFIFVLVATGWCLATGVLRTEWSAWREERRRALHTATAEPEQQVTVAKPWKK
ncbi:hypothetical protein [Frigoriglobus tundricola]|uniref:Uncharacterized protein n=1 Tax=Frigoriglobus tundricola TaxID=2774151 RepID=A0A6M5Z3X5_9BACT|nr:hypothetical protein [Frigoriglobus tundricola]QJX00132.1 hypothetical protein FTUN_7756 [Frigoriglobus tundricola]